MSTLDYDYKFDVIIDKIKAIIAERAGCLDTLASVTFNNWYDSAASSFIQGAVLSTWPTNMANRFDTTEFLPLGQN